MEFSVSEFKFLIYLNINTSSTLWRGFFFLSWDSNNEAFTDKIFKFSLTSFKAL